MEFIRNSMALSTGQHRNHSMFLCQRNYNYTTKLREYNIWFRNIDIILPKQLTTKQVIICVTWGGEGGTVPGFLRQCSHLSLNQGHINSDCKTKKNMPPSFVIIYSQTTQKYQLWNLEVVTSWCGLFAAKGTFLLWTKRLWNYIKVI